MRIPPTLLFCPADRPERFAKAVERADAVILDLEDAVALDAKEAARLNLQDHVLNAERTVVRVNPVDTPFFADDLGALSQLPYNTVMLAKTESAAQLEALAGYEVIALIETAAGVVNAGEIAAAENVVALMWGAEDLVASLGGSSSRDEDGNYRAVATTARSNVLLAAGAYGRTAIDAVYLDIADLDGLRAEAIDGAASGFAAKACIHPSQVQVVREAFAPSEKDVAHAVALLAAAEDQRGVFTFEGQMVDEPILRHARSVLARAGR